MADVAQRVVATMRSPVAAAMFVHADRAGVSADDLANPSVALALMSAALRDMHPWGGSAAEARSEALLAVAPLGPIVNATLGDPRNRWWWSDLDRSRQLWVDYIQDGVEPTDIELAARDGIDQWEIYAQKPAGRGTAYTSTELNVGVDEQVTCGLLSEASSVVLSDWMPDYPLRQARVEVARSARVYEIHQAGDWRALVDQYANPQAYTGSDDNLRSSAGLENGPAPDWARVAADWDGVHLSFFGCLTALYTPITLAGTTTTLWAWLSERTLWLRSVFNAVTEIDPVPFQPEPQRCY